MVVFLKKIPQIIIAIIKNWKSEWGSLLILLIPFLLSFQKINSFVVTHTWLLGIVIIMFLLGWTHSNKKRLTMEELEKENKKLLNNLDSFTNYADSLVESLEDVPEMVIKHIYNHLKLDYNDRITVYRYNLKDDLFIPVGRHSLNPVYKKRGRSEYPNDKGFIAKAWLNGSYYVDHLPSYDDDPKIYLDEVSKMSNLDKKTLRQISMKSRSYYCKNLHDTSSDAIAVVVIESMDPELKHTEEDLNRFFEESSFGALLVESIENNIRLGKG